MPGRKKLGELLLEKGLIDKMQLEGALGRQKQWGGRLGSSLIKLNFIGEITLLKFLSSQMELPCADLSKINIDKTVYNMISKEIATKYHVMPIQAKTEGVKKTLFLSMSEPTNILAIEEIEFLTGFTVKPVIVTDSQLELAIRRYYEGQSWVSIEPLTEQVAVIEQKDLEIIHEVTQKEKLEIKKAKSQEHHDPELMALIRLLVKKGLITKDEYVGELNALKAKK